MTPRQNRIQDAITELAAYRDGWSLVADLQPENFLHLVLTELQQQKKVVDAAIEWEQAQGTATDPRHYERPLEDAVIAYLMYRQKEETPE